MDPTQFPYYPINDFGPVMKGLAIGGLGIFHVFLAQFAIGGGLLLCLFQWLAMTGREPAARLFIDGYFKFLVLLSFVTGALTGVGMWFTAIQVSPETIGLMVGEFHWIWAIEWTFFAVEVIAGYAFYRYGHDLRDAARLQLLAIYSLAAWFSLFWINGILAWQLTPGDWAVDGGVWSGFFNPSFWPSLLFRTAASMAIAGLVACVVINAMGSLDYAMRRRLIHRAAWLMAPMVAMPVFGAWFLAVIPDDSRSWATGGSIAMTMFLTAAVGASVLIGGYALVGLLRQRLYINGATATLLVVLAFVASAGGEFVREGVRKPYTVRGALYSNSITPELVATFREVGSVTHDPYPLRDADAYPTDQLRLGRLVYRRQCSVCHSVSGANGLTHLTGSWTTDQMRFNISHLQHTKPFMPPFAGTPAELEALVQWIAWENAARPADWTDSDTSALDARLRELLADAGTRPGDFERHRAEQP